MPRVGRFSPGHIDGSGQIDFGLLLEVVGVRLAGNRAAVLLFLGLQNIDRTLVTSQQVGAVVGRYELAKRLDTANHHQEIVLAFQCKDRVDQIVARAFILQVDFQAIPEEGQQIGYKSRGIARFNTLKIQSGTNGIAQPDPEVVFQNDPDHAQSRAAKRVRVLGAGRFSSIAQKPARRSSFSARATATATGSVGTLSLGPCGL